MMKKIFSLFLILFFFISCSSPSANNPHNNDGAGNETKDDDGTTPNPTPEPVPDPVPDPTPDPTPDPAHPEPACPDECLGVEGEPDTTSPLGTLIINDGAKFTLATNPEVSLTLTGTDDKGIVAYAYTTTPETPAADSNDWVVIDSTTNLNQTNNKILEEPLNEQKTIYAWLKDEAGNVSEGIKDEIEVMSFYSDPFVPDGTEGEYSSIAVSPEDVAYMSLYVSAQPIGWLRFDNFENGNFGAGNIDHTVGWDVGRGSSLAFDQDGFMHAAYRAENHATGNAKLKYATNKPDRWGRWVNEIIEDGGLSPSIALDSGGKVHIAHLNVENAQNDDVYFTSYVTNTSGAWSSEVAINFNIGFGNVTSMILDSTDRVHIVATGVGATDTLEYTNGIAGALVQTTILGNDVGYLPSIAHDSLDNIYIVYKDYQEQESRFMMIENIAGSWVEHEIDTVSMGSSSIALDSQDKIHIVYYDWTNKDLKYATNYTGEWMTMVLDSEGDVGNYCDIAIDSHDRLHISYYDAINTNLKYATTKDNP